MMYIFALSFGIDNFLFRNIPISFFQPIPLASILSLIFVGRNLNMIQGYKFDWKLLSLFIFGILVGTIRYFAFYDNGNYIFFPIIRQSASFLLGIVFYFVFKELIQKFTLQKISKTIVLTSIFFLLIGIIQKLVGQQVGHYIRVTGLFMEPSYFGDYLVLVLAPFLLHSFIEFSSFTKSEKKTTILATFLWFLNIVFVQSGTAVFKLLAFIVLFFMFYPGYRKVKIGILALIAIILTFTLFMNNTYTSAMVIYALEIWHNPDLFFQIQSFYDRIYPLYSALHNFFTFHGFIGLGFGGDYFEFTNLFPPITHTEMILTKPSLSFFNSFASKIILYFGIFGLIWLGYLFRKCFQIKSHLVKISFLSVLFTSLWGIANFSLPYFWFWLALSQIDYGKIEFATKD